MTARCNKYKQIHSELESQLSSEQFKVRDLTDKNRQLKEKIRAISGLGGREDKPFDPTKYQAQLDERDGVIKKLEHDVEVLYKAKGAVERRQHVKAKENLAGKDHYKEQASMLEEELERKSKEVKENQVLIRKLQSQMRRMKLEITSLQKLNQVLSPPSLSLCYCVRVASFFYQCVILWYFNLSEPITRMLHHCNVSVFCPKSIELFCNEHEITAMLHNEDSACRWR